MATGALGLTTDSYLVHGTKFEVDTRYKVIDALTHGAHGITCLADDTATGEKVAIKKIEDVFEHTTITKRTLRELRILRHLQHENLMQVKNIFITGAREDFDEVYFVTELMEADLDTTLRSSKMLTDEHYQFFFYQLLRGMKYVHSAQVIHRDLKPRNLLVNSNCDLKIRDFACARVRFDDQDRVDPMTEYVCTRWYRAPEVLCSWTEYSGAIDVWSIGCVLAEMYTRKTTFPGQNTQHQIDLIVNLLGSPTDLELQQIPNEKCRNFIGTLPQTAGRSFAEEFANMAPAAQDVLARMLRWRPEDRISVFEAIQVPYLEQLHCPEDEPTRDVLEAFEFGFEQAALTPAELREEIFQEALIFHPHVLQ